MEIHAVDDAEGERPAEHHRWFQGEARIQRFPSPFDDGPTVFAVHFRPGSRTRPHVHAGGQVLHIAAGRGMVGDASGRREVRPGDVVVTMPGEWHWHGAAPDEAMTHVSVQRSVSDPIDWDVDERDWADGYPPG